MHEPIDIDALVSNSPHCTKQENQLDLKSLAEQGHCQNLRGVQPTSVLVVTHWNRGAKGAVNVCKQRLLNKIDAATAL